MLIGLAVIASFVGPWCIEEDPLAQNLDQALKAPSLEHPFGTDHLGRSVLSRLVHGTRHSLILAAVCVGLSVCLGTIAGLTAGLFPGFIDNVIMRLVDGLMAFPGTLLAIVLAGTLGSGSSGLVLALVLSSWCDYCRLVRNIVRSTLNKPYMEAGRLLGFDRFFLTRRYLLGQITPHLFTLASLGMGRTILNVSSLGFLGIGLRPPTPEWGAMITQGLPYLSEASYLVLFPGAAIFGTVLSFQIIAGFSKVHSQ